MEFSFAAILLLLLSGGMNTTDLVEMAQPGDFFKSRQIEPTVDQLLDLAIADPTTGQAQIRQLMALRQIAVDADNFKKAKNYATNRMALEEVAEGKRAQDPLGFAQEYARRALARLDGKKLAPAKSRPLREDALNWFPADTKLAFALDARPSGDALDDTLKQLLKLMPETAKGQMYDQMEKWGNIRIERFAFGMVDAEKRDDQKIFMRFTGKGNQAWIAESLTTAVGGITPLQSRQFKDADGTPITQLQQKNRAPVFLLVGQTDLLIVGYSKFDGKHEDVVAETLDVRAKKKPHAGTGTLKDRLAKISDKAIALLVGDLPNDEFKRLIEPVPTKISAFVERTPMGLDVKLESAMADAGEAAKLVETVGGLRKKGIAGLQQAMMNPPPPGTPPIPYQAIITFVESVQVQNQGDTVRIGAFMSNGLIQQLGQTALSFAAAARGLGGN